MRNVVPMHALGERERDSGASAPAPNSVSAIIAVFSLLLPILAASANLAAAPIHRDNLDGTRSAVWTLDTTENLTLDNVTLGGGEAKLDVTSGSWVQTTWADFANGIGENVSYFPEGSLSLAFDLGQERIVVARDRNDIYSIAANGSYQWTGAITGKVTRLDTYDWDGDGYEDDVVAASDGGNNPIMAFDSQGGNLWNDTGSMGMNQIKSFDQDRDGKVDEVVTGGLGGTLRVLNEIGVVSWSVPLMNNIDSITIADLDRDGVADDIVVGMNVGSVVALNRTGDQLWTYPASGDVTHVATVYDPLSRFASRIAILDSATNLTLLNETGTVLWSKALGGAGGALAATDFDDDGIMDDVAAGDNSGTVVNYDSDGVYLGGYNFNKSIVDIAAFDFNTIGGNDAIEVGDMSGDIKMLNETGYVLRGWSPKSAVGAVADARVDGDNYGDCVVGLNNGMVIATGGSGATVWTYDVGAAVNDVIRIRGRDSFKSNGSWESQIFDAGASTAWGSLRWNSSAPTGTNISFMTRSGNTPLPDATWSPWSASIWISGLGVESPSARYLQTHVDLTTIDVSLRPVLFDFSVGYGKYAPFGFIETDFIAPPDLTKWDVFNASIVEPIGTSIMFWFSNDSGPTWLPLSVGQNLSTTISPSLRFRADLATSDQNTSPLLLELSVRYEYIGPLSRLEVNPPSWSGLIGDSFDFDATGYDSYGRLASFSPKWATNDPLGVVDSNGLYVPGLVGIWKVYANNSDDTVSGYADVTVLPGILVRIEIRPWNPGVIAAGSNVVLSAVGFNSIGGQIGPVASTWTVNGGIGQVSPSGSTPSVTFAATRVGIGSVTADDGSGHSNTTAPITVVAGVLGYIDVTPSNVNVPVSGVVSFAARGFDAFGNPVQLVGSVWTTNVGTLSMSNDTATTLTAQGTPAMGGYVMIAIGDVEGQALVNVLPVDTSPLIIGIIPNQVMPEDYGSWSLDLRPRATDPQDPPATLKWQLIGRNASLFSVAGLDIPGNHVLTFTTMPNAFGNDRVTLRLLDPLGNSDEQQLWINITPVNDCPTFEAISPLVVHYDVPYNYYFHDYVDDVETPKDELLLTSSDAVHISIAGLWATFNYPLSMNGTTVYPAFTVQDEEGATATTVVAVSITDDYVPTIIAPLPDVTLFEGQELLDHFDLDDYFSDPDQDALFYAVGYTHVEIAIDTEHKVDFRALSDWFGVESAKFVALDPHGARVEDVILITVLPVNDPPTISDVPDLVVHYDDPIDPAYNYTFDLSPYIRDPDNAFETLNVWTSDPTHIRFYPPRNMVMSIHYPASMIGMVVIVEITVSDGLAQATDSILIKILEDWPPVILMAIPDQILAEDTTLYGAFNISDYFSDRDGDNLYFSYGNKNTLVTIDPLTNKVNLSAIQDWNGVERVTFRASDPSGAMAEYTITITVVPVNDPPSIKEIPEITATAGETLVLDLRNYVSDVDNSFEELEFNITSDHPMSVRLVAGYIMFSYGEDVSRDHLRLSVWDGNASSWRDFEVVVIKPQPQTGGALMWIFLLMSAILLTLLAIMAARKMLLKMVIEEAILIHIDGRVIARVTEGDKSRTMDDDIFSAMLTVIQDFAHDSFKNLSDTSLKRLEFGDRKILMRRGSAFLLAVIYSGQEKKIVVEATDETVKLLDEKYGSEIRDWDGMVEDIGHLEDELKPILEKARSHHHGGVEGDLD